MFLCLCVLFLASALASPPSPPLPPHHIRNRAIALKSVPKENGHRGRQTTKMAKWAAPRHTLTSPWSPIYPTSFGADPTGVADSTAAFAACLKELLSRNTSGHSDEGGTWDLGGATIDLQGGDYLINSPILFPSYYSNYGMIHGTLRAGPSFPPTAYMIEFGTHDAPCSNWGDSCTENGFIEDMLLDGGGRAYGGLRFNAVIGVNAGPDLFVVNFTTTGVEMYDGHEVLLHESWVGSCWYTPPSACWLNPGVLGNTTGVLINGNDHILDDVIVFAALQGIVVNGAACLLSTCHTWNTQSGSVSAAAGIQVNSWQNRLVAPYLDYVPLVLMGAALTTVTDAFFLVTQTIFRVHHTAPYPVQGIYIAGSQYVACGGMDDVVAIDDGPPGFSGLEDVTIVGAMSDNAAQPRRSTVCTKTSLPTDPPPWVFDFSDCLVFNASHPATSIQTIQVSVVKTDGASGGFVALADPAQGPVVTVKAYLGTPAYASVSVTVDQSTRPKGGPGGR